PGASTMREDRKKVWIHNIQTKLFLRMGFYWVIYQVGLWNLVFAWRLLLEGPGNVLEQYGRFCLDYYPAFVACLVLLPFIARDTVKFTHRVVGPIHRFRQTLQSVTAGQPVRLLKLRDGDFLEEMKDDFNAMLEALQRQGVPALKPTEANEKDEQRQPA